MTPIAEADLRLVADSALKFFSASSSVPAKVTAAFLGESEIATHDFTGLIHLTGQYEGRVIVSAPLGLLRELLLTQGESNFSHENLQDAVGEIANTIAGNMRGQFGPALQISVPECLSGQYEWSASMRSRPYVISLNWSCYSAMVCVDIMGTGV